MRNVALFTILALAVFGVAGNVLAYEGGTKMVASMNLPGREAPEAGPLLIIPHNELAPGKPVTQFLRRLPEPTLAADRIREEGAGFSKGTKAVVLFQRQGRI